MNAIGLHPSILFYIWVTLFSLISEIIAIKEFHENIYDIFLYFHSNSHKYIDNTEKGDKYFKGLIRWKDRTNKFSRFKDEKTTKEIYNLPFKMYFELPYFLKDKGSFHHIFLLVFKTYFKIKKQKTNDRVTMNHFCLSIFKNKKIGKLFDKKKKKSKPV